MAKYDHAKEKSQLLNSLLSQVKKKGYILADTIVKRFNKYKTSDSELEDIYASFEDCGIEVIFNDEDSDIISQDDLTEDSSSETNGRLPIDTSDTINTYIREIHEFPTLSHKETLALVKRIGNGDLSAREYLINCNLKFAFSIASKFAKIGVPFLDLIQQANLGLMNAVDRYNPNRGSRFTTYSVFWIKQSILGYVNDQSRMIRLPRHICTDLNKIKKAANNYYIEYMEYPTASQIADMTGFSAAHVMQLQNFDFNHISTDTKPDEEMGGTLLDSIASYENDPGQQLHMDDCSKQLMGMLKHLTEREQKILVLHYGLNGKPPLNLEEIGALFNLTRERIRQIESRALNKLRSMPEVESLYDYLHF